MTYTFRLVSMLTLLLLTSLLTACGFHLRGEISTDSEIRQLSVSGNDPVFIRNLSKALERSGIAISDQAPWRLNIISVERDVNQQTVASAGYFEQRVAMNVAYQLQISSSLPLFSPVQLIRERYLTQNQNAPNAAESEQSIILSELQQELIAAILRRVHSLSESKLAEEAERVRAAAQPKAQMEKSELDRSTQP